MQLMNLEQNLDGSYPPIRCDRSTLISMPREEVFVRHWPTSVTPYRYYRSAIDSRGCGCVVVWLWLYGYVAICVTVYYLDRLNPCACTIHAPVQCIYIYIYYMHTVLSLHTCVLACIHCVSVNTVHTCGVYPCTCAKHVCMQMCCTDTCACTGVHAPVHVRIHVQCRGRCGYMYAGTHTPHHADLCARSRSVIPDLPITLCGNCQHFFHEEVLRLRRSTAAQY